jgi:endonuclease III
MKLSHMIVAKCTLGLGHSKASVHISRADSRNFVAVDAEVYRVISLFHSRDCCRRSRHFATTHLGS